MQGGNAKLLARKVLISISCTSSPSIGHCWKYLLLLLLAENFFFFFFGPIKPWVTERLGLEQKDRQTARK